MEIHTKVEESSACVIIAFNRDNEILFLKRNVKPFGFGLPGGKIEKGETLAECASREFCEETGLPIAPGFFLYYKEEKSINNRTVYVFVLTGRLEDYIVYNTLGIILSEEHSEYMFMPRHEAIRKPELFAGNTLEFLL